MDRSDCPKIIQAMKAGGYFARIMSSGPELDRVKEYLLAFAGERKTAPGHSMQDPTYPCFPGLQHKPFHDADTCAGVALLEKSFETIRDEALKLSDDVALHYTAVPRPTQFLRKLLNLVRPQWTVRGWTVYLFYHMGVNVEVLTQHCPRTLEIIDSLPNLCVDYPWGDALLSIQGPQSYLPPHCSVDNLRLRCHLGIQIPEETGIRVGTESRSWTEGKCLLFEDSIEHEVWNRGVERRLVLIVDFWHPDLTDVEVRALTAGFCKSEVREIFMRKRIQLTNSPEPYVRHLERELAQQDRTPLLREFWSR